MTDQNESNYYIYMGHEFNIDLISYSIYHGKLIRCKKCKVLIRLSHYRNNDVYYDGINYFPLINCNELIIKNIIE